MNIKSCLSAAMAAMALALPASLPAQTDGAPECCAYLFTYFTGNRIDEEAICLAVSNDGHNFRALNGGKPVLDSRQISSTGGMRDPHILRAEGDSVFYMVATDMVSDNGWDSNRAMVLMKSYDLVNWTSSVVNIQKKYPGQGNLKRVWAPQTIYDPQAGKYLIYWSMQHGDGPDIIYYAYANPEFTDIEGEPKQFFFPADGKSCIDGDIVARDGKYYLFYKTEGHGNGIRVATSDSLTSGRWAEDPEYKQQTTDGVEGAGTFKLIGQDKYILMYDVYTRGRYEFTETDDFVNFRMIDDEVTMDFHPRHGTVIPITRDELARLTRAYGTPEGIVVPPVATSGRPFEAGQNTFMLHGEPFVVKAAEVHYPRIPREYWEHRIKMCKALGMNTLCIYVFWNLHEPRPGEFDFSGNNDIAEFCRLAQKHGMYVIVRPGPYVCAEWEMGGLPWWLLQREDIRLREQDPYFMERVRIFEQEVGKQLAGLTISKGGPIIMVQVENEYGSYGADKPYVSAIRDIVRQAGFDDVELFQCDWSSNFEVNGLDDLVWTMNFGTGANIDEQFRRLQELRPDSPLMCSEFWSGWFDKWGANHETRKADDMVAGIDEMLNKGISFSLYMTHGGTSFGHWAGANSPGFAPDVTSYDYDAPITEWGAATPKYHLLRQTMQKHSPRRLPAVPKAKPVIAVPQFKLGEFAPLAAGIQSKAESHDIKTMEAMGQGWGCILYETTLPALPAGSTLAVNDAHDYAQVFINGEYIGKIDRVRNERLLVLPAVNAGDRLAILVEGMGRINFGRAIKDFKGITQNVTVTADIDGHSAVYDLKNWTISLIPDDYAVAEQALAAASAPAEPGQRGYYRGTFNVSKPGDTFLDLSSWGKGQAWVNGHALGRFWKIGPQQTLYVPGCWMRKGQNEVVILDIVGPADIAAQGLKEPLLDSLNLEKRALNNDVNDRPDLKTAKLVAEGEFAEGNGWQTVKFPSSARGRYLAIEALSTHDSGAAAIAELYALDRNGQRINREPWTAKYANSENTDGNHTVDKVFDLQESTYWQTVPGVDAPHVLVVDLGTRRTLTGIDYLPRAEQGAPGSIKAYRIYLYE